MLVRVIFDMSVRVVVVLTKKCCKTSFRTLIFCKKMQQQQHSQLKLHSIEQ